MLLTTLRSQECIAAITRDDVAVSRDRYIIISRERYVISAAMHSWDRSVARSEKGTGRIIENNQFTCSCDIRWIQIAYRKNEASLGKQSLFCTMRGHNITLHRMNISQCDVPGVSVSHSSLEVHEGHNAVVTCNGSGSPLPDVDWAVSHLHSISTHQTNVNWTNVHSINLTLVNVSGEDNGSNVTCIAENVVGMTKTTVSLTIYCKLDDDIDVDRRFKWYAGHVAVCGCFRMRRFDDVEKKKLLQAASYAGRGIVKTTLAEASAYSRTTCIPNVKDRYAGCMWAACRNPPRILSLREPVVHLEHCIEFTVRGNPYPVLTWYHNNQPLRPVDFIRQEVYKQDTLMEGCLLFNKPTHYYNGNYTLIAKNKFGIATQTVYAHFLEQPYPVADLGISPTPPISVTHKPEEDTFGVSIAVGLAAFACVLLVVLFIVINKYGRRSKFGMKGHYEFMDTKHV
ncbi:unnamed protein product [Ranitomeya imitator]|uniref:Ig-like domain-containing protein n=1 Tax=Ranitomeya imitator TaxID=111125 RepID=A0ABN9L093_9NEOB|nr:unnamed protein product [Ranitomeya imitator]